MDAGCGTGTLILNLQRQGYTVDGFDIDVDNPYPVALPLLNLDYDLSSGDVKSFLSGAADLQTTIPAKSSKTVSLPATINYLEMLKALRSIKPGTKIPYQADLGLSVDTPALGRLRIPMGKEGEVYVPKPSDIDINDILGLIKKK